MELSTTYIWLGIGVVMLLAEAMGISGVGLIFAGLACLTVGALVSLEVLGADATLMQVIVFLMATAAWTLVLWKPMRRFYSSHNKAGYSNMVGDTAYIGGGGLKKGETGEATWSGTIMKARLADDAAAQAVGSGIAVEIVDVKGATLIVKPKA